jgi:SAM-dependent MidA family methyltransferase
MASQYVRCFLLCLYRKSSNFSRPAFEMTEEGWRERLVDMAIRDELLEDDEDESGTDRSKGGLSHKKPSADNKKRLRLRIVTAPEVTPALKTLLNVDDEGNFLDSNATSSSSIEIGHVVEVCPEGILLVQEVAALLEQQGGAALIVDYGEEGSTDSLRGFWKHEQTNFLSRPGQVDVTADVDFTALKLAVNNVRPERLQQRIQDLQQVQKSKAKKDQVVDDGARDGKAEPIKAFGPIPQGKFLVAMGARERVIQAIESDSTTDEEAEDLYYALERLVAPEEMGMRYKVLAIAPERRNKGYDGSYTVPPPGF